MRPSIEIRTLCEPGCSRIPASCGSSEAWAQLVLVDVITWLVVNGLAAEVAWLHFRHSAPQTKDARAKEGRMLTTPEPIYALQGRSPYQATEQRRQRNPA